MDARPEYRDTRLSAAHPAPHTVCMQNAQTVWLVERLHVDLGRARTMMCR
jgi:hypothetical protein